MKDSRTSLLLRRYLALGSDTPRAIRTAAVALALLAGCSASDVSGGGAPRRDGSTSGDVGVRLPAGSFNDPSSDLGANLSGGACSGITIAAENQRGPADIIFALDNSGSMDEEAGFVQENMNAFSEQIVDAAIDAHVVVISSYPGEGNGICIDAPLGSGACPDDDSKAPTFLHVDQEVDSNDALELMIETFPRYRSMLRPEAQKHLVVVTDDESDLSAARATAGLLGLAPPAFDGFVFHGIFAFTEGDGDTCEDLSSGEGERYRQLVEQTGGVSGDLCLQDFKPVFDRLAQAVVGRARLACEWAIPTPPTDAVFDPALTNVRYSSSAVGVFSVPRAPSLGACASAPDGWAWHYDNETNPSSIVLCPEACSTIRADDVATVDVEFGCPTRVVLF